MGSNRWAALTWIFAVAAAVLAGCSAGGAETPEAIARMAIKALKAGKLDPLDAAMMTAADVEEMVATVRRNGTAAAIEEAEGEVERNGGPEKLAEKLTERNREGLKEVLEFARGLEEPIDWSKAEFGGMIEERTRIRREAGLRNGDLWFWVKVGEKRYAVELDSCVELERGWVCYGGMGLSKSMGSLAANPEEE